MTIRTNLLLYFLFTLSILALAIIGVEYWFGKRMAQEAIDKSFHTAAHRVVDHIRARDILSKEILYQTEAHSMIETSAPLSLPQKTLLHFTHTLQRYDNMYAIYLGYPNGDLFEVVNMRSGKRLFSLYNAPSNTRWTVIWIHDVPQKGRVREFLFFDDSLNKISGYSESSDYRVTNRPWYREALSTLQAYRSDPYLFSNLKEKGITYAKKLPGNNTVLALDFTLESINTLLASLKFSPTNHLYMYGRNGELISATPGYDKETDKALQSMLHRKKVKQIHLIKTIHGDQVVMVLPLSTELEKETYIGISRSYDEAFQPYLKTIYYAMTVAFALLVLFLILTLFLTKHIVKPLKALMKENRLIKERRFKNVQPVKTNILEFRELSDSQIAMSESIQSYEEQLETLLDSFIRLIADAIDAKSAYTGSHCKKVPVIAAMLAEAAEQSTEEPFCSFSFENDDQKKAFERAAWLHDCGKITTPEYVVDKATKLETIYNRIHEIRTRFEVLWRDVEIEYYKRLLNGEEKAPLKEWKQFEQERLTEEFAFVAKCNIGREHMDEKDILRLQTISERTWLRYFNDKLGLSEEELSRYDSLSETLPAVEKLLDDKQSHLLPRHDFNETLYRQEGFTLPVPRYLYNRGELYNLSIQKGTLTKEERYKINEHVIMTIKMLERLPFPENMSQIPKIAGEHHETMDGKGYPRSLTRDELSIPSRIMAIADIFEALTASDRPYKKAKTLSDALKIMYTMKKENHIDADLFDLFITSGIYISYAKDYLHPEQIDEVDEKELLG